jgi:hypothetical protein
MNSTMNTYDLFGKLTMTSQSRTLGLILLCLLTAQCLASDSAYLSHDVLCEQLSAMARTHSDLVQVDSLGQSVNQRTLWLVRLAASSDQAIQDRPAMLVVAGIEGNDLFGTTVAMRWMDTLVSQSQSDPNAADLLKTHTIYVIPRVNMDAAEHFFDPDLQFERTCSDTPFDDDRDDESDEDGPDDLNQDGRITWMRVKDRQGEFIWDPQDSRLLLKADPLKGEVGQWRYLPEGIDNDQDEQWNEDGPGGVNFNRNFPFNYDFFGAHSGRHQISEPETRALADFIVSHPRIGLIVTYGAADNLLSTPKSADPPGRGQPMIAIQKDDIDWYEAMGKRYREALGLKKEVKKDSDDETAHGTFSDWMYYHRGRLSLAVSPWTPHLALAMFPGKATKEPNEPNQPAPVKKEDQDKRNGKERAWLTWSDQNDPNAFVPWQVIDHPDFPGKTVEVGGYAPYALSNPPAHLIEDLSQCHTQFLTDCATLLPRVTVRDLKVKHLGESVFDLEIQIENTGFLPTSLAQGQTSREVYATRVILDVPDEALLTGSRIQALAVLQGSGAMDKAHWILHCPDRTELKFECISMLAGRLQGTVTLKR